MKGIERLSFPRLTRFSTAPSSRCIVGSRRLAGDARNHRGARSLAPPVVRKATLPFLGAQLPPPRLASSSILQFKMAAAAAAAAAMAPPGCPGSCPNFAVVCSFLERYGPLLDLPELPFPELERVLQAPPPDVGSGEGKQGARTPGGKRPWHAPSLLSPRTSRALAALSSPWGAAPPGPASPPSPQGLGQWGGGAQTP